MFQPFFLVRVPVLVLVRVLVPVLVLVLVPVLVLVLVLVSMIFASTFARKCHINVLGFRL